MRTYVKRSDGRVVADWGWRDVELVMSSTNIREQLEEGCQCNRLRRFVPITPGSSTSSPRERVAGRGSPGVELGVTVAMLVDRRQVVVEWAR